MAADENMTSLFETLSVVPHKLSSFSENMCDLFSTDSDGINSPRLLQIRNATRDDAVVYMRGILPALTSCIGYIGSYYENVQKFNMNQWWENIDVIIANAGKHKQGCQTLVKMHEEMLVSLKMRQDETNISLKEMKDLTGKLDIQMKKLKSSGDTKTGWAIGLAIVPFVNLIASPILAASASDDYDEMRSKHRLYSRNVETWEIVSGAMIPALDQFVQGLEEMAGVFEGIHQELISIKAKGERAYANYTKPKMLHYKSMMKKANFIKVRFDELLVMLPEANAKLETIPTRGLDQNYVQKSLDNQKRILSRNCRDRGLEDVMLRAIQG